MRVEVKNEQKVGLVNGQLRVEVKNEQRVWTIEVENLEFK